MPGSPQHQPAQQRALLGGARARPRGTAGRGSARAARRRPARAGRSPRGAPRHLGACPGPAGRCSRAPGSRAPARAVPPRSAPAARAPARGAPAARSWWARSSRSPGAAGPLGEQGLGELAPPAAGGPARRAQSWISRSGASLWRGRALPGFECLLQQPAHKELLAQLAPARDPPGAAACGSLGCGGAILCLPGGALQLPEPLGVPVRQDAAAGLGLLDEDLLLGPGEPLRPGAPHQRLDEPLHLGAQRALCPEHHHPRVPVRTARSPGPGSSPRGPRAPPRSRIRHLSSGLSPGAASRIPCTAVMPSSAPDHGGEAGGYGGLVAGEARARPSQAAAPRVRASSSSWVAPARLARAAAHRRRRATAPRAGRRVAAPARAAPARSRPAGRACNNRPSIHSRSGAPASEGAR
ncbi:MAG: hypothetical protein KatS3mg102_2207 [Planctomycetota bacterium]|nr:MAG: hypothetical protein KatS3mg102_2207 [Planctomycetota bacterium]